MKYVVCVPDGCADEPLASLGGRTPLEVASMPTLRALALRGRVGRAAVIPAGMPPGSDVGNMSIFGYDPARFHTGRAPIEAAALGLKLGPDRVAYRCNLVAVDLVRGLGVLTDVAVVDVPGATAGYDNDYGAQRDAALDALRRGTDVFIIHVEASDEAGHAGDMAEKIRSLELWDSQILADLVPGLDALGAWRMLLLPDHATPLRLKTHTADPVPYLLYDSEVAGAGGEYTERYVATAPLVAGHDLMAQLLGSKSPV